MIRKIYNVYVRIFGMELSPVWRRTWTKMIDECATENKSII